MRKAGCWFQTALRAATGSPDGAVEVSSVVSVPAEDVTEERRALMARMAAARPGGSFMDGGAQEGLFSHDGHKFEVGFM